MEAEDGSQVTNLEAENYSKSESMANFKTIKWEGDWNQFKRLFKATARLNGVAEAVEMGELVAQGAPWPDNKNLQEYGSALETTAKEEEKAEQQVNNLYKKASKQSP